MKLESNKTAVAQSAENVFKHLTALENFDALMPENKEKFEIDGDSFIFSLKGMPEIRLVLQEKTPSSKIVLGSASSKLAFSLAIDIRENGTASEVQLFFNGEFNAMMSMMVKKPLTKFIETLAENIGKL